MRRILLENARRKRRPKHGGGLRRIDLDGALLIEDAPPLGDLIALDEALTKLAAAEPVKAKLVQLRYFAGLTVPEAAEVLGISTATAERYWTYARTWLYCALNDPAPAPET
jgi:RNA polymerase sigma factor (TIGR02999 family)